MRKVSFMLLLFITILNAKAAKAYEHCRFNEITDVYMIANPELTPQEARRYAKGTIQAAETFNVPIEILTTQVITESTVNPQAHSKAGAIGLIQIMPLWIRDLPSLGVPVYYVRDLLNPELNLLAGAAIYSHYYSKTKGNTYKALCYYNAGPSRWKHGRAYAEKVMQQALHITL